MVVTIVFWGLLCGAVLTAIGFLLYMAFRELDISFGDGE